MALTRHSPGGYLVAGADARRDGELRDLRRLARPRLAHENNGLALREHVHVVLWLRGGSGKGEDETIQQPRGEARVVRSGGVAGEGKGGFLSIPFFLLAPPAPPSPAPPSRARLLLLPHGQLHSLREDVAVSLREGAARVRIRRGPPGCPRPLGARCARPAGAAAGGAQVIQTEPRALSFHPGTPQAWRIWGKCFQNRRRFDFVKTSPRLPVCDFLLFRARPRRDAFLINIGRCKPALKLYIYGLKPTRRR